MGKKSKKPNKTQDGHFPVSDEVKIELEDDDFNSETNYSNSVKKSKKKRRLDDPPAQTNSDEINECKTPAEEGIKKKKKKKSNKNNEKTPSEEVQTVIDNLDEDQLHIRKKKKKKLGDDIKQEIEEATEWDTHKPKKDTKKNKNNLVNEVKHEEIIPKPENEEKKQRNKKSKNKAKTGAPVLNNEEAQVTEEDIDKFIDELDEEDNKQYEDWVKLLDARLSKKTMAE